MSPKNCIAIPRLILYSMIASTVTIPLGSVNPTNYPQKSPFYVANHKPKPYISLIPVSVAIATISTLKVAAITAFISLISRAGSKDTSN